MSIYGIYIDIMQQLFYFNIIISVYTDIPQNHNPQYVAEQGVAR